MGVGSTLKALVLLYNKRGRAWPPAAWTRRVGKGKSHARSNIIRCYYKDLP